MIKIVRNNIVSIVVGLVGGLIFALSPAPASENLGGITLVKVLPRIITPNGDTANDKVFFQFDNALTGLTVDSAVYDIHGARVSRLVVDSSEMALTWDGRDESGRRVPAGVYLYSIQIGSEKKRATGTVVVAL